jgi:uncharacterized protein (DUF433 family)
MNYEELIHDRGRGPEIRGTRITVYSILDFVIEGWYPERIAEFFQIHPQEVEAAWAYIRAHTLEVLREYVKILERSERGNPPELQAKLDARHEQFLALVARVRAAQARGETDISALIQEYRAGAAQEAGLAQNHGGQ